MFFTTLYGKILGKENKKMTDNFQSLLYALSGILMTNEEREAVAVRGYNEQLKLIEDIRALAVQDGNAELLQFLEVLEAATKEKISDELNHGESLYREYVELTGIQPATD